MKNLLVIFIWIFVSVPLYAQERGIRVEKPTGLENSTERKFAILVGVTEYVQPDKFPTLTYTVNDVNAWQSQLMDIGFERNDIIVRASGGSLYHQPTKKNILDSLHGLLQKTTENDIIYCVFSGHGTQVDKTPYFCPQDAKFDDLAGSCISLNDILDDLKRSPAKFKWLIVDACRNDPSKSADDGVRPIGRLESVPKGVSVIFSCAENQRSYEDMILEHGVFTHFLIEGLSGKAVDKNGCISILDLYKYVEQNTREFVQKKHNLPQIPYWGGDFTNITLRNDLPIEGVSREQWQKAQDSYLNAVAYREKEDYRYASSEIKKSLAILPKKREFLDEWNKIEYLRVKINRSKANVHAESALKYLKDDDYQKATKEIEKALNLFPDDSGYLGTKHAIEIKMTASSGEKRQTLPEPAKTGKSPSIKRWYNKFFGGTGIFIGFVIGIVSSFLVIVVFLQENPMAKNPFKNGNEWVVITMIIVGLIGAIYGYALLSDPNNTLFGFVSTVILFVVLFGLCVFVSVVLHNRPSFSKWANDFLGPFWH